MKKMFVIRLAIAAAILLCGLVKAQSPFDFNFTTLPSDYQLFPRNTAGQATVTFAGTINWSVNYQYVKLKIYSKPNNGVYSTNPIATVMTMPTGTGSPRNFTISYTIPAGLTDYKFQFGYVHNNTETMFKTVQEIVCGDVYLINGQSNAIAQVLNNADDNAYENHFSRAYGMYMNDAATYNTYNPPVDPATNGGWGLADAYSNTYFSGPPFNNPSLNHYSPHYSGMIGLRMQQLLIQQYGVPVAVINGAAGGVKIADHLPNAASFGSTGYNLYNFLKTKAQNAGVAGKIKGILWYQGEGDTNTDQDICDYDNNFQTLYNAWMTDFPTTGHILLFQVNTMQDPTASQAYEFNKVSRLREMQRQIAVLYPNTTLVPTVGNTPADRSDNLHYTPGGYVRLGDLAYRVLSKVLFGNGSLTDDQCFAPLLLGITASGNTITLEYNRNVSLQQSIVAGSATYYLKDHFLNQNDARLTVNSISASGKFVYLTLPVNNPLPTKLTYLPSFEYNPGQLSDNNTLYAGPWITSAANTAIGVASFYQVSVGPDFTAGTAQCINGNTVVPVSTPAQTGLYHEYQVRAYDAATGHFTGPQIGSSLFANSGNLTFPGPGTYVIIHGTWSACKPWSFTEMVYTAPGLVTLNSGITGINATVNGITNRVTISANAAAVTPGSYWDLRQNNISGALVPTTASSSPPAKFGNSVLFGPDGSNAANDYLMYGGGTFFLVHGVWGGCTAWTWTGATIYTLPAGQEKISVEMHLLSAEEVQALGLSEMPAPEITETAEPVLLPETALAVWPNPADGNHLHVQLPGEQLREVALYDLSGRLVAVKPVSGTVAEMEFTDIEKGCYIICVTDASGVSHIRKVIFR